MFFVYENHKKHVFRKFLKNRKFSTFWHRYQCCTRFRYSFVTLRFVTLRYKKFKNLKFWSITTYLVILAWKQQKIDFVTKRFRYVTLRVTELSLQFRYVTRNVTKRFVTLRKRYRNVTRNVTYVTLRKYKNHIFARNRLDRVFLHQK